METKIEKGLYFLCLQLKISGLYSAGNETSLPIETSFDSNHVTSEHPEQPHPIHIYPVGEIRDVSGPSSSQTVSNQANQSGKQTFKTSPNKSAGYSPKSAQKAKYLDDPLYTPKSNTSLNTSQSKPRVAYKAYTKQDLEKALECCRQGMMCARAARKYNIPYGTLYPMTRMRDFKVYEGEKGTRMKGVPALVEGKTKLEKAVYEYMHCHKSYKELSKRYKIAKPRIKQAVNEKRKSI